MEPNLTEDHVNHVDPDIAHNNHIIQPPEANPELSNTFNPGMDFDLELDSEVLTESPRSNLNSNWSSAERLSLVATGGVSIFCVLVAVLSASNLPGALLWLAASVGGLGGVLHEFAQSRGKIFFFKKEADGLYLGSLTGLILGGLAGLLWIKGYTPPEPLIETNNTESALTNNVKTFNELNEKNKLILELLFAGLALKGVVEAATSNPIPQKEDQNEEDAID